MDGSGEQGNRFTVESVARCGVVKKKTRATRKKKLITTTAVARRRCTVVLTACAHHTAITGEGKCSMDRLGNGNMCGAINCFWWQRKTPDPPTARQSKRARTGTHIRHHISHVGLVKATGH